MSRLIGKCGEFQMEWKEAPLGTEGKVEVIVNGVLESVSFIKERQGITIELKNGVFSFDLSGEIDESENKMLYRVKQRNSDELFESQSWKNESESFLSQSNQVKKKSLKIKSQMPGKILKVFVKNGDSIEKGQPLLTMEAMKMENEIRAVAAGVVESILVSENQAVETGAVLVVMA